MAGLCACLIACNNGTDKSQFADEDGDGFTRDEDCNDANRFRYPGAPEACDLVDNDCDGLIDEGYDRDGDGVTTCAGDCADNNDLVGPKFTEFLDGIDNNCDGVVDNLTDAYDDDGDGYSEDQGDCNDSPGQDGKKIGPASIEIQWNELGEPEGLDNDCDGLIDEDKEPCPVASGATSFAHALDACMLLSGASFPQDERTDPRSRSIQPQLGEFVPETGDSMVLLSTGIAAAPSSTSFFATSPGANFGFSEPHPLPEPAFGCSSADPTTAYDATRLWLSMQVPWNAQAFSFDFALFTAEFPEFICTSFDDTFVVVVESDSFSGNVVFDANGDRINVNSSFLTLCDPQITSNCMSDAALEGTGYRTNGAGTGWLRTSVPVVPGEKITMTFMVFEEGDGKHDTSVLLDNFQWLPTKVPSIETVAR